MSVARALLVTVLLGGLSPSTTALAQANGDPGSAMLGIARAREHAEARTWHGIERWRQEVNAWQDLRRLYPDAQ